MQEEELQKRLSVEGKSRKNMKGGKALLLVTDQRRITNANRSKRIMSQDTIKHELGENEGTGKVYRKLIGSYDVHTPGGEVVA